MIYIIESTTYIIFIILYIQAKFSHIDQFYVSVIKSLPAFTLALFIITKTNRNQSKTNNSVYQSLIAIGLLACGIGDFALNMEDDPYYGSLLWFIVGLVFFLSGHIFFIYSIK